MTNPLSAELSELRVSLMPGLVTSLRFNLNREARAFHAFEIGKTFRMDGDIASEHLRLAAFSYGPYAISAIGEHSVAAGFFTIKGILETYFDAMGISDAWRSRRSSPPMRRFCIRDAALSSRSTMRRSV